MKNLKKNIKEGLEIGLYLTAIVLASITIIVGSLYLCNALFSLNMFMFIVCTLVLAGIVAAIIYAYTVINRFKEQVKAEKAKARKERLKRIAEAGL